MPNHYRLKGATLEEIRLKAELQHGPKARVVSAERVISPGIAGLFAGDHFEAMIEVPAGYEEINGKKVFTAEIMPDPIVVAAAGAGAGAGAGSAAGPDRTAGKGSLRSVFRRPQASPAPAAGPSAAPDPAVPLVRSAPAPLPGVGVGSAEVPAARSHQLQNSAIAALLEEADAAEMTMHRPVKAGVSTESPDFAELLEQLGSGLRSQAGPASDARGGSGGSSTADAPARPVPSASTVPAASPASPQAASPVPAPLSGVGDLVVLIGLGEDALDTALAMSTAAGGADVRTGGKLSAYGHLHVDGRQGATAARAQAVLTERTVLVAYGLGRAGEAATRIHPIAALGADQFWVVVDAGRKQADTERWVRVLAEQLPIEAVAVIGIAETGTPETVNRLELPVGWIDARQARVAHF